MAGEKAYLGDAVYVEYDRRREMVRLTTEDGLRATNQIWLEDEVLAAFVRWLKALEPAEDPVGDEPAG